MSRNRKSRPRPDSSDRSSLWFLGPAAERAAQLETLAMTAIRDHVSWRRSYHPEDQPVDPVPHVDEATATATLTAEFHSLLAALKRDVPFFSERYLGHMLGEQTLASQLGYFAAMLYNPNNVAAEVSPVTSRLEVEVSEQLATMIGYAPERSWGHLTSGGTLANFEALWIARSLRYHAVALALAAADVDVPLAFTLPDGTRHDARDLPLWSLLNIAPGDVLDADREFHRMMPGGATLPTHSLAAIGYQDYTTQLERVYGSALPAGVVVVAATAHYSWEKITRALGIGSRCMRPVPVDSHARMDPDALWDVLQECATSQTTVLAVVSVCGSTEEGAVDRLGEIAAVRERAAAELGVTFHWHADACYGGYAAAVIRDASGHRRTAAAIRESTGIAWPSDGWCAAITALEQVDSITIDPHKLGYVPYPAGAFLLRDRRARSLVAIDPPYLTQTSRDAGDEDRFLGRWILEGSKPGAAAAAVWLSHRVVPLDQRGYGHLIERVVVGAHRLHSALAEVQSAPCRIVTLPPPDLGVVNWVMTHPEVKGIEALNALNEAVYHRLSPEGGEPSHYITRTRLNAPSGDGIVLPLLDSLGVSESEWRAHGLVVLRAVVMSPYLAATGETVDHVDGLVAAVCAAAEAELE